MAHLNRDQAGALLTLPVLITYDPPDKAPPHSVIPRSEATWESRLSRQGLLMYQLLGLLSFAVDIYILLLIVRVLMSWVQPNPYNPAVQFICRLTDPFLDAIRNACPFLVVGGLDLSPIAAIFLLEISRRVLLGMLL